MTDTEQFFVRVCDCGVVHLSFGPAIVNATPETVIAITETLKGISAELRNSLRQAEDSIDGDQAVRSPHGGNVVRGRFPAL